ncbi:MAG: hypothetical protein ACR2OZ_13240 [Verrucomicrobiales bacterium]
MKTPHLFLTGFARFRAFLLAAASLLCLLAPPAHAAPGDLDATFGTGGKVTTDFGSGGDSGRSMAVQSDGKIVVAGYSRNASGNDDIALVRYTSAGALDTSFNGTGKVTTDIGSGHDQATSVAVQSDGNIVVAGISNIGPNADIALVRYTSTGELDTSFNGTGKVTTPIGSSYDEGFSVAVQSDGRIVVAGHSYFGSNWDIALVRYTSTGALDTSFNGTGKVTTDIGSSHDYGESVAVQNDGKIVVAGDSKNASADEDVALVRYTSTGALDTSFNGTGKVTTPIGSGQDRGYSVAVQSDGRIVVAGYSYNASGYEDFALVRYTSTGALDTSFNGTGKVTTDFLSSYDRGFSVAVQSDGKIVVAGQSYNASGNEDFALVRYEGDPVDLDLDGDGLLDSWEVAHFGTTASHSALDDFDHEGYVELLELAFGLAPTTPNAGGLPAIVDEGGYLTATITRQPGVTYEVQSAGTLQAAQPDSFSPASTTVLIDTATTLKVRDNTLIGTPPARFMRVKVTAAP